MSGRLFWFIEGLREMALSPQTSRAWPRHHIGDSLCWLVYAMTAARRRRIIVTAITLRWHHVIG